MTWAIFVNFTEGDYFIKFLQSNVRLTRVQNCTSAKAQQIYNSAVPFVSQTHTKMSSVNSVKKVCVNNIDRGELVVLHALVKWSQLFVFPLALSTLYR